VLLANALSCHVFINIMDFLVDICENCEEIRCLLVLEIFSSCVVFCSEVLHHSPHDVAQLLIVMYRSVPLCSTDYVHCYSSTVIMFEMCTVP